MNLLVLCFLFLQNNADFIVVEEPQKIAIFDKFKNRLSAEEKAFFPAFAIFEIKESFLTFDDGLTKAMSVIYLDKLYYFEKIAKGKIKHAKAAGKITYYSNSKKGRQSFFLNSDINLKKEKVQLRKSDKLRLIFSKGNMAFFYFKNKQIFLKLNMQRYQQYLIVDDGKSKIRKTHFKSLKDGVDHINQKMSQTAFVFGMKKTLRINYFTKEKSFYIKKDKVYGKLLEQFLRRLDASHYKITQSDSLVEVQEK